VIGIGDDVATMTTVRLQDRHHRRSWRVHGVSGAERGKRDGSLHLFYTLCDYRLEGAGDDESNYAEDHAPAPITCKRCQAVLARWANTHAMLLARDRARRAATTAAGELIAYCEQLDLDAVCARYAHPEDRAALRAALEREIEKIRRFAMGKRLEASNGLAARLSRVHASGQDTCVTQAILGAESAVIAFW